MLELWVFGRRGWAGLFHHYHVFGPFKSERRKKRKENVEAWAALRSAVVPAREPPRMRGVGGGRDGPEARDP